MARVRHRRAAQRTAVFRHGVASFDPTDRRVLLWTRLEAAATARWTIARDPQLTDVVASGVATTGADDDHTVVVDVGGLEPDTSYWYRFEAAGQRSPVGRTRTLPDGPTVRWRLGIVCCADYSEAPLTAYRALAQREVDLVLHLGDYMYETRGRRRGRPHRPPREAVTLDDYRRRLAQLREDPDLQALHLRHPMAAIWDDHDLADNAWREGAKHHDPTKHGPWSARVEAAARARQEWVPARLTDPDRRTRIWRSLAAGDLAELVLLDTRYTGRDRQAGDEGAPPLHDPARSLLGDEQRRWLGERITDRSHRWVLVASGVVVNCLELPVPASPRLNVFIPNGYAVLDGKVLHDDQWDGYPVERDRLIDALEQRRGRAVLLSGDVHSSWAFEGPSRTDQPPAAVEFTAPAVTSAPMGRTKLPGLWRVLDDAADRLPHVRWADVTRRGFVLLDVTPDAVEAEWWFVNPYDLEVRPELGAAWRTIDTWPPELEATETVADPERAGLPDELPARPGDLRKLRRRHRARRVLGATVLTAAVAAAATPAAEALRRRLAR